MHHRRAQLVLAAISLFFLLSDSIRAQEYSAEERGHWSLRPRTNPSPPELSDQDDREWIRNPVDAFVLRRLLDAGLRPAEQAEPAVLVRRLYLHLTGLPPTPEEVASFVSGDSPDAYETACDACSRASPQ